MLKKVNLEASDNPNSPDNPDTDNPDSTVSGEGICSVCQFYEDSCTHVEVSSLEQQPLIGGVAKEGAGSAICY